MEDKLIEEYRKRSVEYYLPLPEDGWDKLEAAFAPAPEVRRFPYRWLVAAVSLLALMGSALYFLGIEKELEPVLSNIVLPVEKEVTPPVRSIPDQPVKPLPVANKVLKTMKQAEVQMPALSQVVSEVYMSVSTYFQAEAGSTGAYNKHSVVESSQSEPVSVKTYEPAQVRANTSAKGWSFGLYAGNMFACNSSATGGLRMLNAPAGDIRVNANQVEGTFDDYMKEVASNAPSFRDPADYELFEKIAAENYHRSTGTKVKHRMPVSVGLSVKKQLNERLSLESGLIYTFLASELTAGEGAYYKQEQQLHYLGIPLKVHYTFWKKDRFSLYASAGTMAEMCVDGRIKTEYYLNNTCQRKSEAGIDVKKIQFSALAALGVQYDIAKPVSLYAEPGIVYSFDDKRVVETIRKEQPLCASVQLGVRFTF